MTQGLQELELQDVTNELENGAAAAVRRAASLARPGHCMRVSDLDAELMVRLCARLRAELPNTTVVVLSDGTTTAFHRADGQSTKLVELRNPLPDGTQRPPLLVFVPSEVRASAEDSFGVATFEEVARRRLRRVAPTSYSDEMPSDTTRDLQESLRRLRRRAPVDIRGRALASCGSC